MRNWATGIGLLLLSGIEASADAAPTLVAPNVLSTPLYERGTALTADGRELYFTVRLGPGYLSVICVSRRDGKGWSKPEVVSFSGRGRDTDAALSPDGQRLYFATDRKAEGGRKADLDIWVVEREGSGWGAPRPVDGINSPANETSPVVTKTGRLYFASGRTGRGDIFQADPAAAGFAAPQPVGAVNGPDSSEIGVAVNADESLIVVAALDRPDEALMQGTPTARGDLYLSRRQDGAWQAATRLPDGINSTAAELAPSFSPDGRDLYFTSERGFATDAGTLLTYPTLSDGFAGIVNGLGNIYVTPVAALGERSRTAPPAVPRTRPAKLPPPAPQLPAEVQLFAPEVLGTALNEFSAAPSADGREVIFTSSVPRSYMYAFYSTRRVGDRWTTPELLPFTGRGRDTDSTLSPDGRTVVFLSDRPLTPSGSKSYDLWRVDRTADGKWGEPRNLGAPINIRVPGRERDINETSGHLLSDGSLLMVGVRPGGAGGPDIYLAPPAASGGFGEPVSLGTVVNSPTLEAEPAMPEDRRFLLFAAYERPGGYGDWDIWISRRQADGSWGEPENLGPSVNTAERDYSPQLMSDGHTVLFTSERHFATGRTGPVTYDELLAAQGSRFNGYGNIYSVDLRRLGLKALQP